MNIGTLKAILDNACNPMDKRPIKFTSRSRLMIIQTFSEVPMREVDFICFLCRLYNTFSFFKDVPDPIYITLSDLYNHILLDVDKDVILPIFVDNVSTLDVERDNAENEISSLLHLINK